jgi:hypothetical protein
MGGGVGEQVTPDVRDRARIVQQVRDQLRREGWSRPRCVYCGRLGDKSHDGPVRYIESEHFFPRGTPGRNVILPACLLCNRFKKRMVFRSLDEARAYLKPLTDEYRRVEAQDIRRWRAEARAAESASR